MSREAFEILKPKYYELYESVCGSYEEGRLDRECFLAFCSAMEHQQAIIDQLQFALDAEQKLTEQLQGRVAELEAEQTKMVDAIKFVTDCSLEYSYIDAHRDRLKSVLPEGE